MKAFISLTILLLLAACTTPASGGQETPQTGTPRAWKATHSPEEAERFIRRFEGLRVGLVNYFHPGKVELISREFTAETVVFRLNSTGDTGAFHEAAVDLAVTMADTLWERTSVANEVIKESHLATITIRSIGIPSNAKAGDEIPVRIEVKGNATDIHGGYVYMTPLRNRLGRTVALLQEGYLPFSLRGVPEEDITPEMRQDSGKLERRHGATGPWFLLRTGVHLAADVLTDDLVSDQIILPLLREVQANDQTVRSIPADMIPDIMADISRQMEADGMPVKVAHEPGKLIITPLGVREVSLKQIYDRIRQLRVEYKPRNSLLIMFDDDLFRIAIYGPIEQRFLIDHVALTTDPLTRNNPDGAHQMPFRVSCRLLQRAQAGRSGKFGIPDADDEARGVKPDGHSGKVRLTWSRWEGSRMIAEDIEELETSDISEILRHLWVRGMGPREVLAFVYEADRAFAINAELGYNYHTIRLDEGSPTD